MEERRSKSMLHARDRIQPMNQAVGDDANVIKERMKAGKGDSIEPMTIDKTVSFQTIGGLQHHVKSLKEMIVFPLMYPDFFKRYKMDPPRGVLFHGPPGTHRRPLLRPIIKMGFKTFL